MGNITTTPEEIARAKFLKHVRRDKGKRIRAQRKNPSKSVRTVSGGLPTLGKRR